MAFLPGHSAADAPEAASSGSTPNPKAAVDPKAAHGSDTTNPQTGADSNPQSTACACATGSVQANLLLQAKPYNLAVEPRTAGLSIGSQGRLHIDKSIAAFNLAAVSSYKILVQETAPDHKPAPNHCYLLDALDIIATPDKNGGINLDFQIPAIGTNTPAWTPAEIFVFGYSDDGKIVAFGATENARMTYWGYCLAIAATFVVLVYILSVLAVYRLRSSAELKVNGRRRFQTPRDAPNVPRFSRLRHFDPVILTAGANGRGSAAKLQILFFSLIVVGLIAYRFALTFQLSDLSATVLELMGIAGVGAGVSAGTDVAKNRLSFDNWAWLIAHQWLPEGGVRELNTPQWRDIVTSDGEFDIYHFQMIAFSVLVGAALITAGGAGLDSFAVPQGLLGILGLSQVIYIGGKLVSPPAVSDLDTAISELVVLETQLASAAGTVSGATANKYGEYISRAGRARTMFQSVMDLSTPIDENLIVPLPKLDAPKVITPQPVISPCTQTASYTISGTNMSLINGVVLESPAGIWSVTIMQATSTTLQFTVPGPFPSNIPRPQLFDLVITDVVSGPNKPSRFAFLTLIA